MADDLELTLGAGGGPVVATDEIGGKHYQRIKVVWGVDGAQVDSSATDPLPVGGALLTAIAGYLDGVEGLLTTIDGRVDGVEALLTAGNAILAVLDDVIGTHDAAAVAKATQIGLEARSTANAVVTDGDLVRAISTLLGKQIVLPYAIPAATESYQSPAAVADTADDQAFAAAGAGIRHYISSVQVFNGHDTVGTEVVIKDGSTVLWRGWAEQTGGGCSARFDPPLRGTANTAVNVANITNGSATYFNLQGYTAAE